jgi:cytochrome P450/glutathione S-transferase
VTYNTIYHPRIIVIPGNPYCELACWALDWWRIPYVEERHAPVFLALASRRFRAVNAGPVVDTGEAKLLNARDVVDYYEARSPGDLKLYPAALADRAEARNLFDSFVDTFGVAVRGWAYGSVIAERSIMLSACGNGVPTWEKWCAFISHFLDSGLGRNQELTANNIVNQQTAIEHTLTRVESMLADGRPFLMGERFTAPDLALAALASPILLPEELSDRMPALNELPPRMRVAVECWRARPAGKFVLHLYAQYRAHPSPDLVAQGQHASGRTLKDKLANFLVGPTILRPLFRMLRRFFPICVFGKRVVVTRNDDVVEVLMHHRNFTISQINAERIDKIDGPFILGMDASKEYDREIAVLHEVVRKEDLPAIREFVAQTALELISAARIRGRIDVVNGLARVVPIRLVAEYFGMPGPNDPTMMRWMRDIFHFIFANITNAPTVLKDALNSSAELRRHMDAQIAYRKTTRAATPSRSGHPPTSEVPENEYTSRRMSAYWRNNDVLGRLLRMQDSTRPWLDDNFVRRNLSGLIVGAVDTTSKFVALAIDELLRRPKVLSEARAAALGGDVEAVRRYAWEAVRFNPHHPVQARFCPKDFTIAAGQSRSKKVLAGSSVYAATLSAMFDPRVFDNPNQFNASRDVEYLHFGCGMHTCFGKYINGVQIPELVASVLRLPNIRRVSGKTGEILYDGPFPNRLVLEFGD